jgi:parallel beta-helix repeat protein
MKKLFLLLLVVLFAGVGYSADQVDFPNIYIDADAGDGGVGSQADPYNDFADINWTTGGDNSVFDYLNGTPSADVTINLQKGDEWREELTVGTDGLEAYRIVIQSYGTGADPIINGSELVTGWTVHDGSVYTASFATQTVLILWEDGDEYIGESALIDVDGPGKFYSDGSDIYMWSSDGEDPDTHTVEVGIDRHAIYATGQDYITVSGIHAKQCGADTSWPGLISFYNSDYAIVEDCTIEEGFEGGVLAVRNCDGAIVRDNIIRGEHDLRSDYRAVLNMIDAVNCTVQRNTISESSNTTWSFGIQMDGADNNIIEYNEIFGPFGNGIYPKKDADGNIIRYNYIHDSQGGMGIQIRADTGPCDNNKVYGNLIVNMELASIQTDGDGAHTNDGNEIFNNTIYSETAGISGISINGSNTNCVVKNNVVYMNAASKALWVKDDSEAGLTSDYNVFYNTSGTLVHRDQSDGDDEYTIAQFSTYQSEYGTQDQNSFAADPLLDTDYSLLSASLAINAGTDPFSDGDGDQYDYARVLVWDDSTDSAVGPWADGVEIGAYGFDDGAAALLIGF